jgi:Protein of unknown function, DUF440
MNETEVLAQSLFRSEAAKHLTERDLEELKRSGAASSGTPTLQWEAILGRPICEREYYEHRLYKPSDVCPYVEKIYAVILVSRDRTSESCYVQWKPALEPYEGAWFS